MTELLKLLEEGRAWSVEALARELGILPEQVKRQMEFLEEQGYLHRVSICGHACRGCSARCGRSGDQGGMPVLWETGKRPVL